jgi:uncharacterized protein YndB with AHSA1/START domain
MAARVIHNSFSIERVYATTALRVFAAHADPKKKRRWFAEGEGFIVDSYSLDFRVGGVERCRFRFGESGPPMTYDGVYLDIAPNERIVLGYAMTSGGQPMSSSLATIELEASGSGTLLRFTEHTAFVDGHDASAGRREGSLGSLEALAREIQTQE